METQRIIRKILQPKTSFQTPFSLYYRAPGPFPTPYPANARSRLQVYINLKERKRKIESKYNKQLLLDPYLQSRVLTSELKLCIRKLKSLSLQLEQVPNIQKSHKMIFLGIEHKYQEQWNAKLEESIGTVREVISTLTASGASVASCRHNRKSLPDLYTTEVNSESLAFTQNKQFVKDITQALLGTLHSYKEKHEQSPKFIISEHFTYRILMYMKKLRLNICELIEQLVFFKSINEPVPCKSRHISIVPDLKKTNKKLGANTQKGAARNIKRVLRNGLKAVNTIDSCERLQTAYSQAVLYL